MIESGWVMLGNMLDPLKRDDSKRLMAMIATLVALVIGLVVALIAR